MKTTSDEPQLSENDEKEEDLSDDDNLNSTQMQTFIFSATLSKDLQQNLQKRRFQGKGKGRKNKKAASTLDELVMKLDFRDPEPKIIDLSPEGGVVSTLRECKVDCLVTDKVCVYASEWLSIRRTGLNATLGRVSLLFPLTIPWAVFGFPIFHRWYSATCPIDGTSGTQSVSFTFSNGTKTAAEKS